MNDHYTNSGPGEQNIAQGDHAIGKQVNNYFLRPLKSRTVVLASVLLAVVFGGGGNVAMTYNTYVVPSEDVAKYAKELGATEQLINSFFGTLLHEKVPRDHWDRKLRAIASDYKALLQNWEAVQSTDPQIVALKAEAKQALDAGDYATAEGLLEDIAKHYSTAAAKAHANNARLQSVQLRYAKAAAYWQKAAAWLPQESKEERSLYLNNAASDLNRIGQYTEALALYQQSLAICREIGNKAAEGATLNNISLIYSAQGDSTTALKYLKQSLGISREIGYKAGEAVTSWNIGRTYEDQGDLKQAEAYMSRAVQLAEELGHPYLEAYRQGLADIRAKLQGR